MADTKRFATRPSCQKLQYVHHQIPRDNTSVDNIDLKKIPVCLYGLKALYRNTWLEWLTVTGIAIYRKEGSFRGRKVPSAEGRFLYGRKLLNKFISKIIL